MLKVTNTQESSQRPCIVKIDSYVPISFRSSSQPIAGARYIRLGDFKTQLLEMQFPADSLVLSGFTLVSGNGAARERLIGGGPSAVGLPIVSLPQGEAFSNTSGIPRLDIQSSVSVTSVEGQAEIRFGAAEAFNRSVQHGRVQFLLLEDILVGLRVLDLVERERHTLCEYIGRYPNPTD